MILESVKGGWKWTGVQDGKCDFGAKMVDDKEEKSPGVIDFQNSRILVLKCQEE